MTGLFFRIIGLFWHYHLRVESSLTGEVDTSCSWRMLC